METFELGTRPLGLDDVVAVARETMDVHLHDEALSRLREARAHVDRLAGQDTPVYGVSTGFGALATRHIPVDRRAQLQRSLVRSHAAGSGAEVEREVVRAMMLLRLETLASGHTGVRPAGRAGAGGAARMPGSPRWCPSTARSAAPATSRRWRRWRWR